MARLSGPPERILDLQPVSFESPNDAWLNVRITVTDETRHWTVTAPAFETVELRELVNWCRILAAGQEPDRRVFEGIEPCLQFEALGTGDCVRLRALFQLEYRPPGLPFVVPKNLPAEAGDEDVLIEFHPGTAGLERFAAALEAELQPFSIR